VFLVEVAAVKASHRWLVFFPGEQFYMSEDWSFPGLQSLRNSRNPGNVISGALTTTHWLTQYAEIQTTHKLLLLSLLLIIRCLLG